MRLCRALLCLAIFACMFCPARPMNAQLRGVYWTDADVFLVFDDEADKDDALWAYRCFLDALLLDDKGLDFELSPYEGYISERTTGLFYTGLGEAIADADYALKLKIKEMIGDITNPMVREYWNYFLEEQDKENMLFRVWIRPTEILLDAFQNGILIDDLNLVGELKSKDESGFYNYYLQKELVDMFGSDAFRRFVDACNAAIIAQWFRAQAAGGIGRFAPIIENAGGIARTKAFSRQAIDAYSKYVKEFVNPKEFLFAGERMKIVGGVKLSQALLSAAIEGKAQDIEGFIQRRGYHTARFEMPYIERIDKNAFLEGIMENAKLAMNEDAAAVVDSGKSVDKHEEKGKEETIRNSHQPTEKNANRSARLWTKAGHLWDRAKGKVGQWAKALPFSKGKGPDAPNIKEFAAALTAVGLGDLVQRDSFEGKGRLTLKGFAGALSAIGRLPYIKRDDDVIENINELLRLIKGRKVVIEQTYFFPANGSEWDTLDYTMKAIYKGILPHVEALQRFGILIGYRLSPAERDLVAGALECVKGDSAKLEAFDPPVELLEGLKALQGEPFSIKTINRALSLLDVYLPAMSKPFGARISVFLTDDPATSDRVFLLRWGIGTDG